MTRGGGGQTTAGPADFSVKGLDKGGDRVGRSLIAVSHKQIPQQRPLCEKRAFPLASSEPAAGT